MFTDVIHDRMIGPNAKASCNMFLPFIGIKNFASLGLMQRIPFSRGSSHITSAVLDDQQRIDPGFLSHPLDIDIMARHMQTLASLASASPLDKFFKDECVAVSLLRLVS